MTRSASLLVLGGAARSQGLRCVRQAQARGVRVVVGDTAENLRAAPDIAAAADDVAEVPYDDPDACVAWARARARSERVAGVYGFREYSVESVAAVAAELGLPGNPPDAVAIARDKHRCREALRAAGFRQPAVRKCASSDDARAFAASHRPGPWVVKPRSAMGSLGVRVVTDERDLDAAVDALGAHRRDGFLVEEFQAGVEISAEGVFVAGTPHVVALTEKELVEGSLVERGHAVPARLPGAVAARARAEVARALTALGLRCGFFHVEAWIDAGEPVLGEVHVRPGGDYIHLMVELVTGVEPYGAVFDDLLGRGVDLAPRGRYGAAAILYLTPPQGVVASTGDVAAVARDPACVAVELDVGPGDVVPPLRQSSDRPGYVLAHGDTTESAWRAARRLHDMTALRVDAARPAPHPVP